MSLYHDIVEALMPLIQACNHLSIEYYIGGSVSSSVHGLPRRTQDVDVIVNIQSNHVHPLTQLLQQEYYFDEQALEDAVQHSLPYNLIHLNTMMKVDLIPLKQRAFTKEEARRAQTQELEIGMLPVRIASAEDAILTKLEWFHMGGQSSSRQWNDILGIVMRQGMKLDLTYLRQWANALSVGNLLEQALLDAESKSS